MIISRPGNYGLDFLSSDRRRVKLSHLTRKKYVEPLSQRTLNDFDKPLPLQIMQRKSSLLKSNINTRSTSRKEISKHHRRKAISIPKLVENVFNCW